MIIFLNYCKQITNCIKKLTMIMMMMREYFLNCKQYKLY